MSDLTKQALIDSFKKLQRDKAFDKITVSDITDDCGLSRQTFYYHFDNIFGMIRWIYTNNSDKDLRSTSGPVTWQEGVYSILKYSLQEKEMITGAYNSKYRGDLMRYYMEASHRFIGQVIAEREAGAMEPGDKSFLVASYSYAFVGIISQWISNGMTEDPEDLTKKISMFVNASFDRTLMAFRQPGMNRSGRGRPTPASEVPSRDNVLSRLGGDDDMDYAATTLLGRDWQILEEVFIVIDALIIIGLVAAHRVRPFHRLLVWVFAFAAFPVAGCAAYIMVGRPMFLGRRTPYHRDEGLAEIESGRESLGDSYMLARGLSRAGAMRYGDDSSAEYIGNGSEYFRRLFEDMERAEESFCMEIYLIREDALAERFKEACIDMSRRGVKVRLIFDDYGYDWKDLGPIREMRRAGCEIGLFHNMTRCLFLPKKNYRNHRKTVIVDGRVAYMGGFNIGMEYVRTGPLGEWRDAAIRIVGGQAGEMGRMFAEDWEYVTGEDISGGTVPDIGPQPRPTAMQIIPGNPIDRDINPLKYQFLAMNQCAQERIWIETPYFVPPRTVFEALRMKAMSGVDVRVIIPDKSDHPCTYWSNRRYAHQLMLAGGKVYEYHGGFIHSKIVLTDDVACSVGSANYDMRSVNLNWECNIQMYGEEMNSRLAEVFEKDLEMSSPYDPSRYENRTLGEKARTFLSLLYVSQL